MILQDWDEIEALRESLREHMAEIHRLRAAAWHAFYALSEINSPLLVSEITRIGAAMSGLRAALAEDRSADTGKTSDVPETNFGSMAQAVDSTEADHFPDAGKMVATVQDCLTVQPKREPLTDEAIEEICWTEMDRRLLSFARAIERAHGIGGEE